jgi:hypothetical protein
MLTPSRRATPAALLAAILTSTSGAQQPRLPRALTATIDAERAVARRAWEVGVRDSFLEYFADDAVRFDDAPVNAQR